MKPVVHFSDEVPLAMRVCSWCKTEMGLVPCLPEQAGKITHGCCLTCLQRELASLPGPSRPTLNNAAAAQAASTQPGTLLPLQVKGTAAPAITAPASDHPSGGPAALFARLGLVVRDFESAIDAALAAAEGYEETCKSRARELPPQPSGGIAAWLDRQIKWFARNRRES